MSLTFTDGSRNGISAFREARRNLQRHGAGKPPKLNLYQVPLFISEGDSWFSIPIHHNIIDFLEQEYRDGVFLRFEKSGDILSHFLKPKNSERLLGYIKQFKPDAVLLSGGGNDLVDELDLVAESGKVNISVAECFDILNQKNFFSRMCQLYKRFAQSVADNDPEVKIIAHSYDYPVKLGQALTLTVSNIGLGALLVKEIGSWIGPKIERALPQQADQREFVHRLIDHFEKDVLAQVDEPNFHYADLRNTLSGEGDWNDEMHPTQAGYSRLAQRYRLKIDAVLGQRYRGLP